MKRAFILVAASGLLASGAALAAPQGSSSLVDRAFVPVQYQDRQAERAATFNDRAARIRNRIERGMHDGSITRPEGRRLFRDLDNIQRKERAFRADGRVDRREFDELSADLDRLGARVRQERMDEQRR